MTGVILINFGGPVAPKPGEGGPIEPFLRYILKDVLPLPLKPFAKIFARLRLPRAKKMYDAIGGASPVIDWTTKQAQALEARLQSSPPLMGGDKGEGERGSDTRYKVYIAMKYGKPSIDTAIAAAKNDGCMKIILLPLFLYRSKYTDTNGVILTPSLSRGKDPLRLVHWIDSLRPTDRGFAHNDKPYSSYTLCLVDIISSALTDWRDIPPPQVTLLFTAHSIPSCSAKNEPYVRQINDSISKIMEHFTGYNYQLAYQSAPFKFGWLGPDVKSTIRRIKTSALLIVPLGFACENLETLYEIDQLYLPYAKKLGMNVKRAPALNDNPIFIDLLADLVLEKNMSF